jgi:hypothetical protein
MKDGYNDSDKGTDKPGRADLAVVISFFMHCSDWGYVRGLTTT